MHDYIILKESNGEHHEGMKEGGVKRKDLFLYLFV